MIILDILVGLTMSHNYKLNHEFEFTTEQINQVLDWAEKHDISYDFVLQLFFDWANLS